MVRTALISYLLDRDSQIKGITKSDLTVSSKPLPVQREQ